MEIIFHEQELSRYMMRAEGVSHDSPLLLDHFLDNAIEVDVDLVCDGKDILIGGILEHIEQAGVHSGDSSCAFPPHSLHPEVQNELRRQVKLMATELGAVGLLNVQFAIQNNHIYVIEVNPRASRTIPFLAKATGLPLAKIGAKCMLGVTLKEQGMTAERIPTFFTIKKPIFPFAKFPGVDPILGPEMRSTGEVMGIAPEFGEAFAKAWLGGGQYIPRSGRAFISVRDADKAKVVVVARKLLAQGFELVATRGTACILEAQGIPCEIVNKVTEGRPHIVDRMKNDEINFIINTVEGEQAVADSFLIRTTAVQRKICYTTTLAGGEAACESMNAPEISEVHCLQALYAQYDNV